ncbi:hypothetical protein [Actinocorallia aurea]
MAQFDDMKFRYTWEDDWSEGRTTYRVEGPRVSGCLSVTLAGDYPGILREPIDADYQKVLVEYGRGPSGSRYFDDREDRLEVFGIRLVGQSYVYLDVMRKGRLTHRDIYADRGSRVWHRRVPDKTGDRAALAVHGAVVHWLTRPTEGYALRLAAAGHRARAAMADVWGEVSKAQRSVTDAHWELADKHARLEAFMAAAEMPAGR